MEGDGTEAPEVIAAGIDKLTATTAGTTEDDVDDKVEQAATRMNEEL